MNYAAILAGGVGSRSGLDYPKQFYKIEGKPIIIYTIEKIVSSNLMDQVYVAVVADYFDYTKQLLEEYQLQDQVVLLTGGNTRMETIDRVIEAITNNNEITDRDIILIHDAVRPFITNQIMKDSIEGAMKYGATVATIPVVDTIVASNNQEKVDSIPNRNELFSGQAPDTFRLKEFIQMEQNLTPEQKLLATGTSQVCTFNHKDIYMVKGDPINFKITTATDLLLAEKIIEGGFYEKNRNYTKSI